MSRRGLPLLFDHPAGHCGSLSLYPAQEGTNDKDDDATYDRLTKDRDTSRQFMDRRHWPTDTNPPPPPTTANQPPATTSNPTPMSSNGPTSLPGNTGSDPPATTALPPAGSQSTGSTIPSSGVFSDPLSSSHSVTLSSLSSLSATGTGTSAFSSGTATNIPAIGSQTVCIGRGLDASAEGILATLVVASTVGLVIWIIFGVVRPRYRQFYGLREWFVQQDLRPEPAGSSFFSFLSPNVPMVPPVPSDVSGAGHNASEDAELFPSDEELSQRTLWICLKIALGWSFVGLAGALPLYLISTPCMANSNPSKFGKGGYSVLEDLSLMRVLRLFEEGNVSTKSLLHVLKRADESDPHHARIRVIVLTVLVLVLGLLPALYHIIKELNLLILHWRHFTEVRCQGRELGWLSASKAPGLAGWGEKQLKDFIRNSGLSLSLDSREGRNGNRGKSRNDRRRRRTEEQQPLNQGSDPDIDIEALFSVGDTHALALLIEERDEVLERLEIAETKYISSFRITTPDPSILDFEPKIPLNADNKPYISRPLPLGGHSNSTKRPTAGRRRRGNPAFAASSLSPSSFVAPSSYYKLRNVRGVSGGRFTESGMDQLPDHLPSIAEGSNSSPGQTSRPTEFGMNPAYYPGAGPSNWGTDGTGHFSPASPEPGHNMGYGGMPQYGQNYYHDSMYSDFYGGQHPEEQQGRSEEEWVDLREEAPPDVQSEPNGPLPAGPSTFRRRPRKDNVPASHRETGQTFPLRKEENIDPDTIPPPHLRVQNQAPFVRPREGFDFDDLGHVYAEITHWRSRLKAINAEIADTQQASYNDVAQGTRIKGWLMVGKGLRFLPGVEMIEGRAKEDIRWDVLQNERNFGDHVVFWCMAAIIAVALAAGLAAAAGLSLSTAPDVAHYIPFLGPLLNSSRLAAGVAIVFAPALAAVIFIWSALWAIRWISTIHGSISVSGSQLLLFKVTFFVLTTVAGLCLIAIGALIYAIQAFSSGAGETKDVSNGSIYMAILALAIILNVAIIFPGLLLLQPVRLWHNLNEERQAITPRQRFRATYPRTYNPSYAMSACILGIVFAALFAIIFPLIGPAVVILLLLTLIAHRFLIGYVYGRTQSQTGGLLQIWLVKRLGTLISLQPILLGLIFLSRRFWILGGVLAGVGVLVMFFVEAYATLKMRAPGAESLTPITRDSLARFEAAAWKTQSQKEREEGTSYMGSSALSPRLRGSMASVLEMMSVTLAVMPSRQAHRGPVPLQTETLDDLTATERAARTHPDAPPHLPPLPFTDHADDMAGILYAPELVAPPPIIWLPNDSAGVARSEAVDLQRYHELEVTIDVRAKEDVLAFRSPSRG